MFDFKIEYVTFNLKKTKYIVSYAQFDKTLIIFYFD